MKTQLTRQEQKAVHEYQAALRDRFPKTIEAIVLFGSKARGKAKKNSDLDLAVIVDKDMPRVHRGIISASVEPMVNHDIPLSPIIIERQEFDHWSPFIENIKKDGQIIWQKTKKNILKHG